MTETNALTPAELVNSQALSVAQLRERLRPFDAIDIINEISATIQAEGPTMRRDYTMALELQFKIQVFRLSKFMPELKAIDHSFSDPTNKVTFNIHMDSAKQVGPVKPSEAA